MRHMKYEYGQKVLAKANVVQEYTDQCGIEIENTNHLIWVSKDDIVPIPDMTAEEAWEIAGKISKMDEIDILEHILDKNAVHPIRAALHNYSPQEVKEKLKSFEEAKENEIKIGDEVAPKTCVYDNSTKFFVTHIDYRDGKISGYSGYDGATFSGKDIKLYQRTGRHIDIEIQGY